MNTFQKVIVGFLSVMIVGLFVLNNYKPLPVQGSVMQSGEYHSTSTDPTFLTNTDKRLTPSDISQGTLGSIVVGVAGTGIITIYDATTTATTTYTTNGVRTDYGTTTLARVNTATQGTYTFDLIYQRGLVVQVSAQTVGSSTITSRP